MPRSSLLPMPGVRITNDTEYPEREVERLVRRVLDEAEVRHVHVKLSHARSRYDGKGFVGGYWRSYWYPDQGEDRQVILLRIPKPGVPLEPYHPYSRVREEGRSFPLADWREGLVAILGHEAEHARQYKQGERRGRRGSGRRRSQVEIRCDLAAYRAWVAYRRSMKLPIPEAA